VYTAGTVRSFAGVMAYIGRRITIVLAVYANT
jgi:hypothetical protein